MENFEKPNIPENPQQSSENEQISHAPEGWRTVKGASNEIDVSTYLINSFIDQYRDSNPEYFKEFKSKTGFPREHIAPELIKLIEEKSEEIEDAPEGWKTLKKIRTDLGRNSKLISKISEKYRDSNPDYFKDYKPKYGASVSEHFSPELVKIIEDKIQDETFPEDEKWETMTNLRKEFDISNDLVRKIINPYRESNPEYFKNFQVRGGRREHYSPELVNIIKEESDKLSNVEGWKIAKEVERDLGISQNIVHKIANKYRESNPEYFKELKTGKGGIFEHYSPELVDLIAEETREFRETPEAPEGWITLGYLAGEILKGNKGIIEKIADQYRETNPDYFKKFRVKDGGVYEHYSPELVKNISEEISKVPIAPDDWKNTAELVSELSTSYGVVENIVNKYKETNPEYFKLYRNNINRKLDYFSPELVNIIYEVIGKKQLAPEGWKTNHQLAQALGKSHLAISNIVKLYREANPEYFKHFKINRGQEFEHYAPELVKIIETEINRRNQEKIPDGWMTSTAIAKELAVEQEKIKKIAQGYKDDHPEYFEELKGKDKRLREHYSPELVLLIKEEINKYYEVMEPLEGWRTNESIAEDLNVSRQGIFKIAEHYRESNPEYFRRFRMKNGINEHYSPELIGIIKTEVNERLKTPERPKDWFSQKELAQELGTGQSTIRSVAEKHRESNPEYFKEFKSDQLRIYEYYSPELVKIIRDEITKFVRAPEGWKTISQLATELNATFTLISRIAREQSENNNEYIKEFKDRKGSPATHYSPELIKKIVDEFEKFKNTQKAPEGWYTTRALSDELKVGRPAINKIVDKYRSNPEYFNNYKDKIGRINDHYSPELVAVIKKELEQKNIDVDEAPEDWLSIQNIAERMGVSKQEAERIAKKIRDEHRGQFGKFKGKE